MTDITSISPACRPSTSAERSPLAKLRHALIYTAFGLSFAFSLALVLGVVPD